MTPSSTAWPPTSMSGFRAYASEDTGSPHAPAPLHWYRFWKRSTRPAESTSFCFPVKKGWHLLQISSRSSFSSWSGS